MHEGRGGISKGDKHEACKAVPQTIPRSPGHMQEWFRMMKEGTPAYSNFDIAAYLTEIILLGCIALRVGEGKRMEWDGPNMKSTNLPEAAQFVKPQEPLRLAGLKLVSPPNAGSRCAAFRVSFWRLCRKEQMRRAAFDV